MNKSDLVNIINQSTNISKKDINIIIDLFLDEIIKALATGNKVSLTNFGTFEKSITKAIDIYSPYDGRLIKNVSQSRIKFKCSTNFKNILKESN